MSSKTTYVSKIGVPIYAAWKCETCGEINFSDGCIVCTREQSTTSLRSSKLDEAKEKASSLVRQEWLDAALKIILNPAQNYGNWNDEFVLKNKYCTKCAKKPLWGKKMRFLPLCALSLLLGIFLMIFGFTSKTTFTDWLIILMFFIPPVFGIGYAVQCEKKVHALPKKYLPVIGSFNAELHEYADRRNMSIPSPVEAIAIVTEYDRNDQLLASNNSTVLKNEDNSSSSSKDAPTSYDKKPTSYGFCHKCGVQLCTDSGFCHKCGTKIIH